MLCMLKGFALAKPFCWPIRKTIEGDWLPGAWRAIAAACTRRFVASGDS